MHIRSGPQYSTGYEQSLLYCSLVLFCTNEESLRRSTATDARGRAIGKWAKPSSQPGPSEANQSPLLPFPTSYLPWSSCVLVRSEVLIGKRSRVLQLRLLYSLLLFQPPSFTYLLAAQLSQPVLLAVMCLFIADFCHKGSPSH